MPQYIYQPLDKPNSEFRLLRINKDPVTHQPQCTLHKYSLTDCPHYIALSYTWGEPTPTQCVAIDGANVEVRQNLFDFLYAYTTEPWGMDDTEKPVFYWIDQICINQEDIVERSEQVRIMNKIYKQAKRVLVWLGHSPVMITAAHSLRNHYNNEAWAVVTLLAHPYFSRIWIIQEIALSVKAPLVICGGVELNWDRMLIASYPAQPCISPANWETLYRRKGSTLKNSILSHCESDCHDPRDKVYGLLGLTRERWRLRVDYTKEMLEVYFDALVALHEELFDLKDPECLYSNLLTCTASPRDYRAALVVLARAMGVSKQLICGLDPFLEHIQRIYLNTEIRNVQYTYTGRIYTRVREKTSFGQTFAPEEEEVEVSWGSITATRRNPLLRDVIPEMGLQLASTTAGITAGQSGDSLPSRDRWWYKHEGKIHYFDGFDDSSDGSSIGTFDYFSDGSSNDSSDDGLDDGIDQE